MASVMPATHHSDVLTGVISCAKHRTQAGEASRDADHQNHQARNLRREDRPEAVEQRRNCCFQQAGEDRHAEQHRQSAKPHREQRRRKIGGGRRRRTHKAGADRAKAVHLQEGADGKRPDDHGEQTRNDVHRSVDCAENQHRIDQIDRDHPDVLGPVEQANQRRRYIVHRVDEAGRLPAGRAFVRILCGAQHTAKHTCEHGIHGLAFDRRGSRFVHFVRMGRHRIAHSITSSARASKLTARQGRAPWRS